MDVSFVGRRVKSRNASALLLEFSAIEQARQFWTANCTDGVRVSLERSRCIPESLYWLCDTRHGVRLLSTPRGSSFTWQEGFQGAASEGSSVGARQPAVVV